MDSMDAVLLAGVFALACSLDCNWQVMGIITSQSLLQTYHCLNLGKFGEALTVLNLIANRNDRPSLPYAL